MTDTFTKVERSEIMRRVKSRDTTPELTLRRLLWAAGVRGYRLDRKDLPGSPDIVIARHQLTVFVDGCFWHGCPRCYRRPSSNESYWEAKLERNMRRDKSQRRKLRRQGWTVLRFWEHEIKKNPQRCAMKVVEAIQESADSQSSYETLSKLSRVAEPTPKFIRKRNKPLRSS